MKRIYKIKKMFAVLCIRRLLLSLAFTGSLTACIRVIGLETAWVWKAWLQSKGETCMALGMLIQSLRRALKITVSCDNWPSLAKPSPSLSMCGLLLATEDSDKAPFELQNNNLFNCIFCWKEAQITNQIKNNLHLVLNLNCFSVYYYY